ncbi:hypothetical protein HPB52_008836 [Rhipicephalus sanguineus]|uniref:Nose resistant-to-fluoxetine protein N-terminal domain-containing protein n=1 Tax=Rhipicephalus sanguineus TaxID=34632 RepID=A0A9D4QM88_RHISA|nr:hypothetical protein HPB52_008836 [Rhipicephalus sanguineus]
MRALVCSVLVLCVSSQESATRSYEADLREIAQVVIKKFFPIISELVTSPELSVDCSSSLLKTFSGLRQHKAWSYRMILSNAMLSNNPLEGTYVAMGGYDQCLRTRVYLADGELDFKGQYCSLFYQLPPAYFETFIKRFHEIGELTGRKNPLTATSADEFQSVDTRGALCTPSTCTEQDMTFMIRSNSVYTMEYMTWNFTFQFIINAFLSVTTFFFISGFLLSYLTTESRSSVLKNNLLLVYISRGVRRYIRLTIPTLVVLVAGFLLPLTGSGPADEDAYNQHIRSCYHNWWRLIVQAQNFVEEGQLMLQALLWCLSLVLVCAVMFITVPWNQGMLPEDVTNSIYGGFHRIAWAIGFCWPTYACATGRGGWLNKMFSWKFFIPLSRLTFCIYLVHVLIYIVRMIRLRTYINTDEFYQLNTALGVFALSIVFAYVLHILIEAPVFQLEKIMFERTSEEHVPAAIVKNANGVEHANGFDYAKAKDEPKSSIL